MGSWCIGSPGSVENTLNCSKIKGYYQSLNSVNLSSFTRSSVYYLAGFHLHWHLHPNHCALLCLVIKGKSTHMHCQRREAKHVGKHHLEVPISVARSIKQWDSATTLLSDLQQAPLRWARIDSLILFVLTQPWGMRHLTGVGKGCPSKRPELTLSALDWRKMYHKHHPSWLRHLMLFCLVVRESNVSFQPWWKRT